MTKAVLYMLIQEIIRVYSEKCTKCVNVLNGQYAGTNVQANCTYSMKHEVLCVCLCGGGGGGADYMHFWETDRKFSRCEGSRRRALVLLIKVGQRQDRGLRIEEDNAFGSRLC
jgi:hypothetical protein